MRLVEFAVTGYKNLAREVRLRELGRINVLHGDNNVGKSNLLEAINLFFALLDRGEKHGLPIDIDTEGTISDDWLRTRTGHQIADIFDLRGPPAATISLEATFSITAQELRSAGIKPLVSADPLVIAIEIERVYGRPELRFSVPLIRFGDGTVAYNNTEPRLDFALQLADYIARNPLVHAAHGRPAFALVEENRRIRGRGEVPTMSILPPSLLLALWDASTSTDPQQAGRWKLMQELVKKHLPPFHQGDLLIAFDRHRNEAFAILEETGTNVRLRHHLLGTGVQQVLAVLGTLLTSDARWVAIEEPECNLRYELQLRLREALHDLASDPRGPAQLFITSHSPAFETEAFFYAMRFDADGAPTVERRPAREARAFVGIDALAPPVDHKGEVAWVSSDGLVVVPPRLRPRLEVESGGEVAFLTNEETGRVEVLSEREFLDLLGPDEDERAEDA